MMMVDCELDEHALTQGKNPRQACGTYVVGRKMDNSTVRRRTQRGLRWGMPADIVQKFIGRFCSKLPFP